MRRALLSCDLTIHRQSQFRRALLQGRISPPLIHGFVSFFLFFLAIIGPLLLSEQ